MKEFLKDWSMPDFFTDNDLISQKLHRMWLFGYLLVSSCYETLLFLLFPPQF